MKKFFACLLTVMMVLSFSVSICAENTVSLIINSCDTYDRLALNDSDIDVKVVKYSYNELKTAKELLLKEYETNYQLYCNDAYNEVYAEFLNSIQGVEIDEINNRVLITLLNCTTEKIENFKSIFTYNDCFSFHASNSEYWGFANIFENIG